MTTNPIDYRAVLTDIENRIAKLQSAADAIKEILAIVEVAPVTAGASGSAGESNVFFGMSIGDATKKHLSNAKRKQDIFEIVKALEEGGITHTSKDFVATVRSALAREIKKPDSELVRLEDGDYGLLKWFPGLRSKQSRTGAQETENARAEQQLKDDDEDTDPFPPATVVYENEFKQPELPTEEEF